MTKQEMQSESLDRARNGSSMGNYPAIIAGFIEKGLAADDIRPRENVFTFNAWKALGRHVKKGEHGVRVLTYINGKKKDTEGKEKGFSFPRSSTVFHVSQTEPNA